MATKRAVKKTEKTIKTPVEEQKTTSSWTSYLNFGESYSSLILGIVVVIVTTILLVFLVKDRNITQQTNIKKDVSSTNNTIDNKTLAKISLTTAPTQTPAVSLNPSPTKKPTSIPTPTVQPKKIASAVKLSPTITKKPTLKPTATVQPTAIAVKLSPTITPQKVTNGKTYTVVSGDNLWKIAEAQYGSGYNWVDIAKANNLENPSVISAGTKLTIPSVTPKIKTVASAQDVSYGSKITGTTYTVQKGDHLWGIAVRAYGDGYKWTEIAAVNNISTPNIIYSGQVIKLPRS